VISAALLMYLMNASYGNPTILLVLALFIRIEGVVEYQHLIKTVTPRQGR